HPRPAPESESHRSAEVSRARRVGERPDHHTPGEWTREVALAGSAGGAGGHRAPAGAPQGKLSPPREPPGRARASRAPSLHQESAHHPKTAARGGKGDPLVRGRGD